MELRVRGNPSFKRKRDNYARKLRGKKLINYLRSELRSCTTHGLPYIVNTELHWIERLFWAASFISSITISAALLRTQFYRYATTPVVSSVEMDYYNWNVSFPAITVCPSYKIEDEDLGDFVNTTLEDYGINLDSNVRIIATISYETADLINFDDLNVSSLLVPSDYSVIATMMYKKFDNNSLTTSANWPVTVDTAMTEMGMCHVINSNVAVLDNPTKWGTAKYSKTNLDLTFYDRDFFAQLVDYADIYKVYLHSPNELIQSTSPYYTSKTDNYIEFGVRIYSTRISDSLRSQPISIRKCRLLNEPIGKRYPIYTYSHCIVECRIKMILKLCDCLPHLYKPLSHERVCNLTELTCWVRYRKEVATLSASEETLANLTDTEGLPRSSKDCNCMSDCDSDVFMKDQESFTPSDHFNSMRVGISSFPKVRVVKDNIVNLYDAILRSGGVLNLCIGSSIISLVELLLLFTKFILFFATKWIDRVVNKIHRFKRSFIIVKKLGNKNKKQY